MSLAYPLGQGWRQSWSSIEIRVNNSIVLGITEINYSPSLEPGDVRGAGPRVIAFTLGQGAHEGDFTILLEEFDFLVATLGDNWMTKSFDIIVTYDGTDGGLSVIQDTLGAVRITKTEHSNSNGSTDASVVKCTIKYLTLLLNGRDPLPAQPTIPQ